MILDDKVGIEKQLEIPEAILTLRSDGLVHAHYKKNTVLDVDLQMRMLKLYEELAPGKKLKVIFSAEEGFVLTKEAMHNAPGILRYSPISHYAIVAHNLAYRIIANFYIRVVKPQGNYKLFKTVDAGARWLNSLENNECP